jgi:hypothetical protein
MNFKKLSKEKRNALIIVVLVFLLAAGGLGFLIHYQYEGLGHIAQKKQDVQAKLRKVEDAVKHATQIEAELAASGKSLSDLESDVASGDLYSWAIGTIRTAKQGYKVDVPQISPVSAPAEVEMLPSFPYKQARFTISGTAHYHDLGRFLADFENQYPHVRVLDLSLEVNPSPSAEEQETISFRMEVSALVKPNAS